MNDDSETSGDHPQTYLGRFRLEGPLGRGGMGEVLRAFDTRLHRHVALKRVRHARKNPTAHVRSWREARALAALRHPGIVALYDILEDRDGAMVIAMELVDGVALSELAGADWTVPRVLAAAWQLARALGHAHGAGIVHRDVKPSNLLLQRDGALRVIDFGLARRDDDESLTVDGALVGTLSYMAPEQVAGEPVRPATDVFAIGSVMYSLMTGAPPHKRESREATVAAVMACAHRPLREAAGVPAPLAELVERCLARDPEARPPDGDALARELAEVARALEIDLRVDALAGLLRDAPPPLPAPPAPARRSRAVVAAAGAVGAALATLVVIGAGADDVASACGPQPPTTCDQRTLACKLGRPPAPGLVTWLDAARLPAGGGGDTAVGAWPDAGPEAIGTLEQPEPARRPQLVCRGIGERPVVRFDGVDDSMVAAADFPLRGDPEFTTFLVMHAGKSDTRAPVFWLWGVPSFAGAGSTLILYDDRMRWETGYFAHAQGPEGSAPALLDRPVIVSVTRRGGGILAGTDIDVDGVAVPLTGSDLRPATEPGPLVVGGWNGRQHARVDVAELIVYDYALDPRARHEIVCWLATKYGLDAVASRTCL